MVGMTLHAKDLVAISIMSTPTVMGSDDGTRMLTFQSARGSFAIFWAPSQERAEEILSANPRISELHAGTFPMREGWVTGIASTELIDEDHAELAAAVASILARNFDDIPALAEIREMLRVEEAEARAAKVAEEILLAKGEGRGPKRGWGG